jgi:putative phosphoesterase
MAVQLGILSDSHGQADRTRRALEALQAAGASRFIHCGDVETEQVLDQLAGLDAHVVFGNCDPVRALGRYASTIGLQVHHPLGRMHVDGHSLAFTHGHDPDLVQAALDEKVHFLLHGHTHERRDQALAGTRVINPGALHRADPFTVALLVPATGELRFIPVR